MKHDIHLAALKRELAYELHQGMHTYHACPCGRGQARGAKCWRCIVDEIRGMEEGR